MTNIKSLLLSLCVIEFRCSDGVFLSCQLVKVVERPARNTELLRGVTPEIDRSPDVCVCVYSYRYVRDRID